MPTDTKVNIQDITVMYVAGKKEKPLMDQAPEAFKILQEGLPSLKGRKFYGVTVEGEYRACVALDSSYDTLPLPHPTWTIPGGRYACRKLKNWQENIHLIGSMLWELCKRLDIDQTRLCIEFYKSRKELWLMAPIKTITM